MLGYLFRAATNTAVAPMLIVAYLFAGGGISIDSRETYPVKIINGVIDDIKRAVGDIG